MSVLAHPRTLPLLVAGAFFMEFLNGTVIATALPAMARDFGMRPVDLSVGVSAYLFTPGAAAARQRLGGGALRRAAGVLHGGAGLHAGLGRLRVLDRPRLLHPGPHRPGRGRGPDGAGGALGRAARDPQGGPHARHGDPHLAGPDGAGDRAAARRVHRHGRVLALDLLHQPAARPSRPRAGGARRAARARRHAPPLRRGRLRARRARRAGAAERGRADGPGDGPMAARPRQRRGGRRARRSGAAAHQAAPGPAACGSTASRARAS